MSARAHPEKRAYTHLWYRADESGWAWFIPLHNGLTSVGIVMAQKELGLRSRASSSASSPPSPASGAPSAFSGVGGGKARPRSQSTLSARTATTLADRYLGFLPLAPGVLGLIGEGELVDVAGEGMGEQDESMAGRTVKSASDYSYCADAYAGEGWRVIGDAGGASCFSAWCVGERGLM